MFGSPTLLKKKQNQSMDMNEEGYRYRPSLLRQKNTMLKQQKPKSRSLLNNELYKKL